MRRNVDGVAACRSAGRRQDLDRKSSLRRRHASSFYPITPADVHTPNRNSTGIGRIVLPPWVPTIALTCEGVYPIVGCVRLYP